MPKKSEANVNFELFLDYSAARAGWAEQAVANDLFRNNVQWSSNQEKVLRQRGHSPIVMNRIHPAVETAKSLLTSNQPRFSVTAREDSDVKMARLWSDILEYIWYQSNGNLAIKKVIDDYYVKGLGALLVYVDPTADMGKGEVLFMDIDPLDVYIDPNSRNQFCEDSSCLLYSRIFTKDQLLSMYPNHSGKINSAQPDELSNYPGLDYVEQEKQTFLYNLPENYVDLKGEHQERYRLIHKYRKVFVDFWHIHQPHDGIEYLLNDNELEDYLEKDAYIITNSEGEEKVLTDGKEMEEAEGLLEKYGEVFHFIRSVFQDPQTGQQTEGEPIPVSGEEPAANSAPEGESSTPIQNGQLTESLVIPGSTTRIEKTKIAKLASTGKVNVQQIEEQRVRISCTIGKDTILYDYTTPLRDYPIITFMNRHNRTPYPLGDISFVQGIQEYINKINSLIIAHATSTSSPKLIIPKGSVNKKEIMEEWARPGAGVIEVDYAEGVPQFSSPPPLPNELYRNIDDARKEIEYILGIYELMQGGGQIEPTARGLLAKDEFGSRRIKSKLKDIESGIAQAGRVVIDYVQDLWTAEKTIRVVQPNQPVKEVFLNQPLFDSYSGELIQKVNDITVGRYDVSVLGGSMLPTNRFAAMEYYQEMYKLGIIDQREVLKKSEVFDTEGILERTDMINKLQGQLEEAGKEIKKLSGDLQTATRESVHDKKRLEVEKFKSGLKESEITAKKATQLYEDRLGDALKETKGNIKADVGGTLGLPG